MTKILTRFFLLGGAVLLLSACGGMPEVRPDGTLKPDALKDGVIRHSPKVVEIPIPDHCTTSTDCVVEVNGEYKIIGGQMTQAFQKSNRPSEQCGGAPCAPVMTMGVHNPGVGDRALDMVEAAIPAYIGYRGSVDSAREYGKAGKNVASGVSPVFNVGVGVATQVLSETTINATDCLRTGNCPGH